MSGPKKVVVTGGAGLIGSTITDQLVAADAPLGDVRVVVLDNFSRGRRENLEQALASGKVEVAEGDIRDRAFVEATVAGADVVFHQAAIRITQCAAEPELAFDVMARGSWHVFNACVKAGVRRLVAASSASIYGQATHFPTTEDEPPWANDTLYGACKVFDEQVLRSFHAMHGLDYVALRYFNVYGPRMDVHGVYTEVLVRWMERLERGDPPLIFGDGEASMDFVFSEDIARANLLAAASDATDVSLNVASGTETTLKELADALGEAMGKPLPPEFQEERKVNAVRRRLAETGRTAERIGFRASISLDEGLRRLVAWWRAETARGRAP